MKYPQNDGWTPVHYELDESDDINHEISRLLNEACHVFYCHAEGRWIQSDKDAYARKLADIICGRRRLIRALLETNDRVIKMLTYRAIEIQNEVEN